MRWVLVASVIAWSGCRREPAPAPAAPTTTLGGDLVDPGAGSGDVVVATVDGRPVWGSCVAGHVRARGVSVDQAVQDCIDLELLAAEAVRRDLVADRDTQTELRAALVDGFVGREFEDVYRTAADLPGPLVESNLRDNLRELDRPELRTVVYARALYAAREGPHAAPGSPEDEAAHALATEISSALAGRDDLFPDDLFTTATRIAGTRFLKLNKTGWQTPRYGGGTNEDFAATAFAIPVVGQVSPPVRTRWGWDVLLLVDILPPRKRTRDELVADLFPGLRRGFFDHTWSAAIAKDHAIEAYPDALAEPGEAPGPGDERGPDQPAAPGAEPPP